MEVLIALIIIVGLIFIYISLNTKLNEIVVKINYLNTFYENWAKEQGQAKKETLPTSVAEPVVQPQTKKKPEVIADVKPEAVGVEKPIVPETIPNPAAVINA